MTKIRVEASAAATIREALLRRIRPAEDAGARVPPWGV